MTMYMCIPYHSGLCTYLFNFLMQIPATSVPVIIREYGGEYLFTWNIKIESNIHVLFWLISTNYIRYSVIVNIRNINYNFVSTEELICPVKLCKKNFPFGEMDTHGRGLEVACFIHIVNQLCSCYFLLSLHVEIVIYLAYVH